MELKRCPFCGEKANLSRRQMQFIGQNYIGQKEIKYAEQAICKRCFARGPIYIRTTVFPSEEHQDAFAWLDEVAAEAWNRRADNRMPLPEPPKEE